MRIIISPAKQMVMDTDTIACTDLPVFLKQAEQIKAFLQRLSYADAKKLWACNDKLTQRNFERLLHMDLHSQLTPAILAYDGIAYKYMAPGVFENGEFSYVQDHLRILSGLYGVLKPMDGVTPYRLEMQAKTGSFGSKEAIGAANLYAFWGDLLYREVMDDSRILINLASKEYSKCLEKFLQPHDRYITCVFGELEDGKIVQKGVYAKMARGEMVRYMAEKGCEQPEEMQSFDRLGYRFSSEYSDEKNYVWLREN